MPAETGKMSGYTPVNCEVSESGGAVCQLPLTAPAGASGMAPKLSLGYNSQGNNGPLGVGWSLAEVYQQRQILTPKYYEDGLHIALATIA